MSKYFNQLLYTIYNLSLDIFRAIIVKKIAPHIVEVVISWLDSITQQDARSSHTTGAASERRSNHRKKWKLHGRSK